MEPRFKGKRKGRCRMRRRAVSAPLVVAPPLEAPSFIRKPLVSSPSAQPQKPPTQLDLLLRAYDTNGDGALSLAEFQRLAASLHPHALFQLDSQSPPSGPPYLGVSCTNSSSVFSMFQPSSQGDVNISAHALGEALPYLARQSHECRVDDPCDDQPKPVFEIPLHVASVFVILLISLSGMLLPIVVRHCQCCDLTASPLPFLIGKHAGTGVLIALGFIHLITPAFQLLNGDGCLPQIFSDYSFAPAIVAFSALLMHLVDTIINGIAQKWQREHRALINEDAQTGHGHHDVQKHEEESEHEGHSHGVIFGDPNRTIGAYILEGALAAHSVIIGLSLGTASTADLYALLPALSFHQFFEGLAMGSRVVEAEVPMLTEAILVVVYSFSAPIGIAIGVGTFSTFDGDAVTARLVQGFSEAISAGIILYVGLGQMLGVDFPRDMKKHAHSIWAKLGMFVAMWLGAIIMAIIGGWM